MKIVSAVLIFLCSFSIQAALPPAAAVDSAPEQVLDIPPNSLSAQENLKADIEPSSEKISLVPAVELKESEIPVLVAVKNKKKTDEGSYFRVVLSMAILLLLGAGLFFFSKLQSKKSGKSTDDNKIRVLTQHFFSPKKSLAIVRVAGETMLIGVTDHNISVLKSLSLVDEDLPDVLPQRFNESLTAADKRANSNKSSAMDESEDFVISSLKDSVSSKIRNMRNI